MQKIGEDAFAQMAALKIFSVDHPKVVTEEIKKANFHGASFKIPAGLRRSESIKVGDGNIDSKKGKQKISILSASTVSSENYPPQPFLVHSRDELRDIFREILVPLVQELMHNQSNKPNNEWSPKQPDTVYASQEFVKCFPGKIEDTSKAENGLCTSEKCQDLVKCHTAAAHTTRRLFMNFSSVDLREEGRYLLTVINVCLKLTNSFLCLSSIYSEQAWKTGHICSCQERDVDDVPISILNQPNATFLHFDGENFEAQKVGFCQKQRRESSSVSKQQQKCDPYNEKHRMISTPLNCLQNQKSALEQQFQALSNSASNQIEEKNESVENGSQFFQDCSTRDYLYSMPYIPGTVQETKVSPSLCTKLKIFNT